MDGESEKVTNKILYDLRKSTVEADKPEETKQNRETIKDGDKKLDPDSIVDLFATINSEENYFDITSVKPNMKEFIALKLKLLRWVALRLSQNKKANVFTRLAIPYNPYHPNPYKRWTLKGWYDLDKGEILVGEEFWNFIGGGNIYDSLLDVFQAIGNKLRKEIAMKFAEFRKL